MEKNIFNNAIEALSQANVVMCETIEKFMEENHKKGYDFIAFTQEIQECTELVGLVYKNGVIHGKMTYDEGFGNEEDFEITDMNSNELFDIITTLMNDNYKFVDKNGNQIV